MANNKTRVDRLEKKLLGGGGKGGKGGKNGGRCPECKGRPDAVWVTFRTTGEVDADGGEVLVPHGDHTAAEPCKRCGWTPVVEEVVEEIVVTTREQAKRSVERARAEGWRLL